MVIAPQADEKTHDLGPVVTASAIAFIVASTSPFAIAYAIRNAVLNVERQDG